MKEHGDGGRGEEKGEMRIGRPNVCEREAHQMMRSED